MDRMILSNVTPTPTPTPTKELPTENPGIPLSSLDVSSSSNSNPSSPPSSPSRTDTSTTTSPTSSPSTSPNSRTSLTSISSSLSPAISPNSSPDSKGSASKGLASKLSEASTPILTKIGYKESEMEDVFNKDVSQGIIHDMRAQEPECTSASASFTPVSSPPSSLASSPASSSPRPTSTSTSTFMSSQCASSSSSLHPDINTPRTSLHTYATRQPNSMPSSAPPTSPPPTTTTTPNPNPARLLLPRMLTKPTFKPIQPKVISALDPDLENVPVSYIVNMLGRVGPRMMATLARTSASLSTLDASQTVMTASSTLPRELVVTVAPGHEAVGEKTGFRDMGAGELDINMEFDTLPTHLLAVYSRSLNTSVNTNSNSQPGDSHKSQRRKVTLFPTHGIILAAHCAYLPALPPGRRPYIEGTGARRKKGREAEVLKKHFGVNVPESILESESESDVQDSDVVKNYGDTKLESTLGGSSTSTSTSTGVEITLPIVPLCIPSPGTFPLLQAYLYTKRADRLLSALIPSIPSFSDSYEKHTLRPLIEFGPPVPTSPAPTIVSSPADLSRQLSMTFTPNILLAATLRIHELWANAAALGIFDDNLWNAINYAWKVLIGALELTQILPKVPAGSIILPQTPTGSRSRIGQDHQVSSRRSPATDDTHYGHASDSEDNQCGESTSTEEATSGIMMALSSSLRLPEAMVSHVPAKARWREGSSHTGISSVDSEEPEEN